MLDQPTNELVTLPAGDALAVFTSPDAIDPILARVRAEIDAFVPDISTTKGRKEVASIAHKVAKAKTFLDDAGKKLADQQKEIPKKIDATRKRIRDTLDAWKDEVRAPLTQWEEAEEARIETHKKALSDLSAMADVSGLSATQINDRLAAADAVLVGEHCEEYLAQYVAIKDSTIKSLREAHAKQITHEEEQAELARLRAEEAARKAREREEQIAREAAEHARKDAEAKAEADRKKAEAEANAARNAAEKRELELKLQAEAAERRAAEAEAKAKREAEQKAAREAEETAKREADKTHRAKINKAALDALMREGISEDVAKQVITLIAQRAVPHISIGY